jgi:hypothetical protein
MSEQHETGCHDGPSCRCADTVRCPAVLIDWDGITWRCIEPPHVEATHESGDWAWTDSYDRVTYARDVPDGLNDRCC